MFQVTLEATHHGPCVEVPACFVEIGSTEDHWHIPEAGELWADVLVDYLALIHSTEGPPPSPPPSPSPSKQNVVLVLCGGGHYCPKLNDFCRLGDRALSGHCLASYAIEPLLSSYIAAAAADATTTTTTADYQTVLDEVIASTAQAHSKEELWLLVDLKNPAHTLNVVDYMAKRNPGIRVFTEFRQVKQAFQQIDTLIKT